MNTNIQLVLFFLFLIWGCNQQELQIVEKGMLEGKVTIGPLCPVINNPPDPACLPSEKTYNDWPIAIWTIDKKTKIAEIKPNLDSNYRINLPEGNYIVNLEKHHTFNKNLPTLIEIKSNKITLLNINIDTGIR